MLGLREEEEKRLQEDDDIFYVKDENEVSSKPKKGKHKGKRLKDICFPDVQTSESEVEVAAEVVKEPKKRKRKTVKEPKVKKEKKVPKKKKNARMQLVAVPELDITNELDATNDLDVSEKLVDESLVDSESDDEDDFVSLKNDYDESMWTKENVLWEELRLGSRDHAEFSDDDDDDDDLCSEADQLSTDDEDNPFMPNNSEDFGPNIVKSYSKSTGRARKLPKWLQSHEYDIPKPINVVIEGGSPRKPHYQNHLNDRKFTPKVKKRTTNAKYYAHSATNRNNSAGTSCNNLFESLIQEVGRRTPTREEDTSPSPSPSNQIKDFVLEITELNNQPQPSLIQQSASPKLKQLPPPTLPPPRLKSSVIRSPVCVTPRRLSIKPSNKPVSVTLPTRLTTVGHTRTTFTTTNTSGKQLQTIKLNSNGGLNPRIHILSKTNVYTPKVIKVPATTIGNYKPIQPATATSRRHVVTAPVATKPIVTKHPNQKLPNQKLPTTTHIQPRVQQPIVTKQQLIPFNLNGNSRNNSSSSSSSSSGGAYSGRGGTTFFKITNNKFTDIESNQLVSTEDDDFVTLDLEPVQDSATANTTSAAAAPQPQPPVDYPRHISDSETPEDEDELNFFSSLENLLR